MLGASHGNNAALVRAVVEFGLDLVTGTAGAPACFGVRIFGERVATLNHETLNDAVKTGAVVKTFSRQRLEIFNGSGCDVRPEFKDHFAFGGEDVSDFVHKIYGSFAGAFLSSAGKMVADLM